MACASNTPTGSVSPAPRTPRLWSSCASKLTARWRSGASRPTSAACSVPPLRASGCPSERRASLRPPRRAIPVQQALEFADFGLEEGGQVTFLVGVHHHVVFAHLRRLLRDRWKGGDAEKVSHPREHRGMGSEQL